MGKRQVEGLAQQAAADFVAFYEARQRPAGDAEDLVVLSCDGKGVIMRHDALRPVTAEAAANATTKLPTRLSRGEKRNRKRMAEVGAVYDATPAPRTPSDILPATDEERSEAAPGPSAKAKWLTASVVDDAACVVGRSQIVGRPVASLLLQRHATVTICHSRTRDLAAVTRQADILVAAIGRPVLIRANYIKPGATVIDVGINRVTDIETVRELFGTEATERVDAINRRGYTLVGDVHPAEADLVAGRRTPVPGGIGLLTVAMLMRNTLQAAKWRRGL